MTDSAVEREVVADDTARDDSEEALVARIAVIVGQDVTHERRAGSPGARREDQSSCAGPSRQVAHPVVEAVGSDIVYLTMEDFYQAAAEALGADLATVRSFTNETLAGSALAAPSA